MLLARTIITHIMLSIPCTSCQRKSGGGRLTAVAILFLLQLVNSLKSPPGEISLSRLPTIGPSLLYRTVVNSRQIGQTANSIRPTGMTQIASPSTVLCIPPIDPGLGEPLLQLVITPISQT